MLKFLDENTSTLGWMGHTSHTYRDDIQIITRAHAALLTCYAPPIFIVTSAHIHVVDNTETDALSRLYYFPTWIAIN